MLDQVPRKLVDLVTLEIGSISNTFHRRPLPSVPCHSYHYPPLLSGHASATEGLFAYTYVDNFDFLIEDLVEMVQVLAPAYSKLSQLVLRMQLERSRCMSVRTLGNWRGPHCGACNGEPCRTADLPPFFFCFFLLMASAGQPPSVNDERGMHCWGGLVHVMPARP